MSNTVNKTKTKSTVSESESKKEKIDSSVGFLPKRYTQPNMSNTVNKTKTTVNKTSYFKFITSAPPFPAEMQKKIDLQGGPIDKDKVSMSNTVSKTKTKSTVKKSEPKKEKIDSSVGFLPKRYTQHNMSNTVSKTKTKSTVSESEPITFSVIEDPENKIDLQGGPIDKEKVSMSNTVSKTKTKPTVMDMFESDKELIIDVFKKAFLHDITKKNINWKYVISTYKLRSKLFTPKYDGFNKNLFKLFWFKNLKGNDLRKEWIIESNKSMSGAKEQTVDEEYNSIILKNRKKSVADMVSDIEDPENKIDFNNIKNNLKTSTDNNKTMKKDKDINQTETDGKAKADKQKMKVFPLKFKKSDIKKYKFYEPVEKIKIIECIDLKKMNFICENSELIPVDTTTPKMVKWLKYGKLHSIKQFHEKILLATNEETSELSPKFFKTDKYETLVDDRIYPIGNLSLSHIGNRRFPIRTFMLDGMNYVDIDIVNCQPNEIRAMMKYSEIPEEKWQYINTYCEERPKLMKAVPDIKGILISILFGGDNWRMDEDLNEDGNEHILQLMKNISVEIKKNIIPIIKKMYPDLYNPAMREGVKKKEHYADDDHLFLASVCRHFEYRLLCFSFNVLKKLKFITENECYAIPCHDGFLIKLDKNNLTASKQTTDKILKLLNKFVKSKNVLGLDFIKWVHKKPKDGWKDKFPKEFWDRWELVKDVPYVSKLRIKYGLTKDQLYDKLKVNGMLYNKDYCDMFLHECKNDYVVIKGADKFDKCLTRNEYGLLADVKDTVLIGNVKDHYDYMRELLGEHFQSDTDWDYVLNLRKLPSHLKEDKDFMKLFKKCHDKDGPPHKIEMLFGNMTCGGVNFTCIQKLIKEKMVDTGFHKEMNKNSLIIAFNNGVFDLSNGKLRNATPEDKQVFTAGYDFKRNANPAERGKITYGIINRLKMIFCDKHGKFNKEKYNWCMEQFALCLCGEQLDRFGEYFINLFGGGGNGKSAIQEAFIGGAFGNYCQEIPTKLLNEEHTTRSPELMRLVDARFIIINEPDSHSREGCRTNTIKKYTGGSITVRDNFAKADEVQTIRINRAWVAMNQPTKYKIQKDLDAMKRRIRAIHLYRKFTDDPLKHDDSNPLSVLSTPEDKEFILRCKNDPEVKTEMILILYKHLKKYMKKSDEDKIKLPDIIQEETDDFIEQSIYGNDEYNFIRKPTMAEVKEGKSYAMDIRTIRNIINSTVSKNYALRTVEEWLNSNYGVIKGYRKHNMECSNNYEEVNNNGKMVDIEDNVLGDGQITGFSGNINKYHISYVRKKRKVVQHVIFKDPEGEYLPLYDGKDVVGFQYVKTEGGVWDKWVEGGNPDENPKAMVAKKRKKKVIVKGKKNKKIRKGEVISNKKEPE